MSPVTDTSRRLLCPCQLALLHGPKSDRFSESLNSGLCRRWAALNVRRRVTMTRGMNVDDGTRRTNAACRQWVPVEPLESTAPRFYVPHMRPPRPRERGISVNTDGGG